MSKYTTLEKQIRQENKHELNRVIGRIMCSNDALRHYSSIWWCDYIRGLITDWELRKKTIASVKKQYKKKLKQQLRSLERLREDGG